MRGVGIALTIAIAACGVGQTGDTTGAGSSGPSAVRLFSETEITAWEDALLKRFAVSAVRTCNAPHVLDPIAPGPLGPDLVALVEPTGELATCAKRMAGVVTAPNGVDAIRDRTPEVMQVESACRATIAAHVAAEAAHTQGCSPYQVGVRPEPESMTGVLHLARFVALDAELGDPWRGIQLIVEYTRALEDLARGRVTLISTMIAVAGTALVIEPAIRIVATGKLSPEQLEQLAGELDLMIAALPSYADTLAGERDMMELSTAMGAVMAPGWTPPGGWPPGATRSADALGSDALLAHPRDIAALMFAVAEATATQHADACPMTATYEACTAGLAKLAAAQHGDPDSAKAELGKAWNDSVRATLAGDPVDAGAMRVKIRHTIIDAMLSIAVPELDKYSTKASATFVRLIALRLQVEVLRTGRCPSAAELASPAYARMLAPTRFGSPVVVTPSAHGLDVAAPAWMGSALAPIAITCP